MTKALIFQLKISLDEIEPSIWRRIQVPGGISLLKLHFILQLAMGWTNSHLHEFLIEEQYYGDPDDDEFDTRRVRDERDYLLEDVLLEKGQMFSYVYDFGDDWQHSLLIEDILDAEDGGLYPICLDGARSCPPEDVGSVYGYAEFLSAIGDPNHPEHEGYLLWAGGKFDPEAFDREQVNQALKHVERSEMVRVYQRYYSGQIGPELELYQTVSDWLGGLEEDQRAQLSELPLRQDAVTLLTYVGENRISGTQATGNFPLKVLREVAPSFVQPLILEEKIGDRTRKIRSTSDVWPIYFLHALYQTGGLLTGGPGRRMNLTPKGLRFLAAEPAVQVWFLLESWWFHTNWLIAFPFSGMGSHLPYDFQYITLEHLLTLPEETPIPYQQFANRLIEGSRLKWAAPDTTHAHSSLSSAIKRMVINILEDFGVLNRESADEWIGRHRISDLKSFSLTRLGKGLLKVLYGGSF
jgi:hypothetical protein